MPAIGDNFCQPRQSLFFLKFGYNEYSVATGNAFIL